MRTSNPENILDLAELTQVAIQAYTEGDFAMLYDSEESVDVSQLTFLTNEVPGCLGVTIKLHNGELTITERKWG